MYDSECRAALEALREFRVNSRKKYANLFTDSLSLIQALNKSTNDNKFVREILLEIGRIQSEGRDVRLFWIRGHIDISGNEIADYLAKLGAENRPEDFDDYKGSEIFWSKATLEARINEATMDEWLKRWRASDSCKDYRHMFENPSKSFTKKLMGMESLNLKKAIEALTGHCHFNKHLTQMRIMNNPNCDQCEHDGMGEEQTPRHLYLKCPCTWHTYGKVESVYEDMTSVWPYIKFFQHEDISHIFNWGFNLEPEVIEADEPVSQAINDATPASRTETTPGTSVQLCPNQGTPANRQERGTAVYGGVLGVSTQSSPGAARCEHLSPPISCLRPSSGAC